MDERFNRLMAAVRLGDYDAVHSILFKMVGTGLGPERLGYLETEDEEGRTPEDVAKELAGKSAERQKIFDLLQSERLRMFYTE